MINTNAVAVVGIGFGAASVATEGWYVVSGGGVTYYISGDIFGSSDVDSIASLVAALASTLTPSTNIITNTNLIAGIRQTLDGYSLINGSAELISAITGVLLGETALSDNFAFIAGLSGESFGISFDEARAAKIAPILGYSDGLSIIGLSIFKDRLLSLENIICNTNINFIQNKIRLTKSNMFGNTVITNHVVLDAALLANLISTSYSEIRLTNILPVSGQLFGNTIVYDLALGRLFSFNGNVVSSTFVDSSVDRYRLSRAALAGRTDIILNISQKYKPKVIPVAPGDLRPYIPPYSPPYVAPVTDYIISPDGSFVPIFDLSEDLQNPPIVAPYIDPNNNFIITEGGLYISTTNEQSQDPNSINVNSIPVVDPNNAFIITQYEVFATTTNEQSHTGGVENEAPEPTKIKPTTNNNAKPVMDPKQTQRNTIIIVQKVTPNQGKGGAGGGFSPL